MNPFINPVTGIPFLKHFFLDSKRLKRMSIKQIEKYRDKAFKKILKYAYSVPVYHEKYKKAGIYLDDIKGIKDITKLPFITKKDLIENFPYKIIPPNYNKNKAYVVSTSGSTGKPVSIYLDFSVFSEGIGASLRIFDFYNLNWRKSRYANIGNFTPGKADDVANQAFFSKAKFAYSPENHISLNAFEPIKEIMKKLDDFKPDAILTYPVTYQHLAYLKKKGFGKNVNPKVLIVSGYLLDEYTRNYVEEAFNCKMYNGYGAAETSSEAAIAFECIKKTWHINHDFYHIETIDDNMNTVETGKIGHIVVTRLFGKATPLIRYTGLDDWVTLTDYYECSCGLCTPTFKFGVEGRRNTSIILPDGRIFPAASFAILSPILNKMKTRKVKQFQIIQKKLDEIDIMIVIDEDLRNTDPPTDVLFDKIKKLYQEKVGNKVTINVIEVKDIPSEKNKPAPIVISNLSQEEREKIIDQTI
ncbi:MAG: phenylacetate--CoA ligase family protein [Thermoplasmatota archaeon]|jgi:phenylacetate-CoA ligase